MNQAARESLSFLKRTKIEEPFSKQTSNAPRRTARRTKEVEKPKKI
jgi:hypothetical protein